MSIANLGKPIAQVRAEGAAKRQAILNCRAYREGERFCISEAARVMQVNPKAVYHILDSMIVAGLLQSHKGGKTLKYSKPGVDWLRIPWRKISNDELLLNESLGVL